MNELELSDREDFTPLTTATSPHKQLSQNGTHHIHNIEREFCHVHPYPELCKGLVLYFSIVVIKI